MRKQTKIAALVSAAALLAIGASMTSFAAWDQTSAGEWIYLDSDGDRVYGEWRKSGENWYYLDESTGVMATDKLVEYEGEWYYVNTDGVRVANAWKDFTANDEIYLAFDQEFGEGTLEPSVVWYRFGENGKALRAGDKDYDDKVVKPVDDRYYVFNEVGQMLSGWVSDTVYKADGSVSATNYYYLGSEGEGWATTGWKQIFTTTQGDNGNGAPFESTSDTWFHFSDKGVMDKGTGSDDGSTTTDFKCVGIDGAYYYFNARGAMMKNTKVKVATPPDASGMNAWVQNDGSTVINGWYEADENQDGTPEWYYLTTKTVYEAGSTTKKQVIRGIPFAMKEDGKGKDDEYMGKVINGKKYLFRTSDGRMVTGKVEMTRSAAGGADKLTYTQNNAHKPTTEVFGLEEGKSGIFFFNTGSGSVNGQLLTGKVENNEDGTVYTYYCDSTGKAYQSVIVGGSLYNEDGHRVEATDGNNYELVPITAGKYKVSTKKGETQTLGYDKDGKLIDVSAVGGTYYIVVSNSGKIKQSASKMKVGDDYVKIENYIVTKWNWD